MLGLIIKIAIVVLIYIISSLGTYFVIGMKNDFEPSIIGAAIIISVIPFFNTIYLICNCKFVFKRIKL